VAPYKCPEFLNRKNALDLNLTYKNRFFISFIVDSIFFRKTDSQSCDLPYKGIIEQERFLLKNVSDEISRLLELIEWGNQRNVKKM
jgi:hypothetical protein